MLADVDEDLRAEHFGTVAVFAAWKEDDDLTAVAPYELFNGFAGGGAAGARIGLLTAPITSPLPSVAGDLPFTVAWSTIAVSIEHAPGGKFANVL
jgi:hypothetical protein